MPEQIADRVLSWASLLDDATREQAAQTARLEIVAGHLALMPDAHLGKGATVGSVIPTRGALIPSAVGVDIGCGVQAVETRLCSTDLPDDLQPVLDGIARVVPAGVGQGHAEVRDRAWRTFVDRHGDVPAGDEHLRHKAAHQHGTLGSGNHFVELCLDGRDRVWVMLHSGSRGVGNQLAQHHIATARRLHEAAGTPLSDPDLAWLAEPSAELDAYVRDLRWAQAYAWENREQMIAGILGVLARTLGEDDARSLVTSSVNNHHNYAALEVHDGEQVWITRKGAISARPGQLGVIPGSMGTGSYVVRGRGNAASWQSAAHGAGRAMSRRQAKKRFTGADLTEAMAGRTWQATMADRLVDEIPGSYKPLETVMADQTDLVEVVHRLETILNYKGT